MGDASFVLVTHSLFLPVHPRVFLWPVAPLLPCGAETSTHRDLQDVLYCSHLSRQRRNFRWWQGWDVGIFCCLLTMFVGLLQLFVPKHLGPPAVESAKDGAT